MINHQKELRDFNWYCQPFDLFWSETVGVWLKKLENVSLNKNIYLQESVFNWPKLEVRDIDYSIEKKKLKMFLWIKIYIYKKSVFNWPLLEVNELDGL